MAITAVPIGATVRIGSLSVNTPYILSFNVRRQRGQISTFDASLKVSDVVGNITGTRAEIYAGESRGGTGSRGSSNQIFSGIVKKATITPCFDDPKYAILNVSGEDILSLLRGKKFTRRCRGQKTSWVSISNVSRKGLKSGKFKFKKEEIMFLTNSDLDETPNLTSAASLTSDPFRDVGALSSDRSLDTPTITWTPEAE